MTVFGLKFGIALLAYLQADRGWLQVSLVDDIAMLHGMGIKLVLVLGALPQINRFVRMRGREPRFVSGYRITDELSMEAAMEAAGSSRVLFEALLSKVHCLCLCVSDV
jgi:amino-acid N-acetyltransferase